MLFHCQHSRYSDIFVTQVLLSSLVFFLIFIYLFYNVYNESERIIWGENFMPHLTLSVSLYQLYKSLISQINYIPRLALTSPLTTATLSLVCPRVTWKKSYSSEPSLMLIHCCNSLPATVLSAVPSPQADLSSQRRAIEPATRSARRYLGDTVTRLSLTLLVVIQ